VTNLVSVTFMVVMNILSGAGKFGKTNSEVSKELPTPITPAGWAFSIWGLIFSLQIAFSIMAALPQLAQRLNPILLKTGFTYPLVWVLEGCWVVAFGYEQILLSLCIIVVTWISLFSTWLNANAKEANSHWKEECRSKFVVLHFVVFAGIGINLGWLTAATTLNGLIELHWATNHSLPLATGYIGLGVILGAAIILSLIHRDVAVLFTVSWACSAIAAKHWHACIGIGIFAALIAVATFITGIIDLATSTQRRSLDEELLASQQSSGLSL